MSMTHRERVLAAIRREPLDRFPTDIWATPEIWRKLEARLGVQGYLPVLDALGIDGIVGVGPRYIGPERVTVDGIFYDEWGMGYRSQAYGTGDYDEQVVYPLAGAQTIDDLRAYRWPSPDWYDYSAIAEAAARFPDRAIECGYTAVFYFHNKLRGLEQSLLDPLEKPEFTRYLLERISDVFTEYHTRCFEAGRGRIDTTQVTDDYGAQNTLLLSPKVFDRFYRPWVQRGIDLAKQYGLLVFHHDDGDMRRLLPRLVEMGIDILNPIQWRCGDWDLAGLKAAFGSQICFHGGVDNQQTLPFGTPEDVRREVQWIKETLGADGTGLIIAPCHNLQPITPVENILALYEAAAG